MMERQSFTFGKLSLGTCYYPEHWSQELWLEDLHRMLASGIETIRIAEFAWSKFEPEEGNFTFAFFDDFLRIAAQTNIKVIFSTPTATPPAWLTEKYPEVLNASKDGTLYRHGMRRHYNYNSPKYQELTRRIVEQMARHYAQHPSIIGWQIDNEFNCGMEEYYSQSDCAAFRAFLQERYHTLDRLNDAWGTVFWNETYTAWDEVYVPRPTVGGGVNPHLMLDYLRFISHSTLRYCRLQAEILRKYIKSGDFITTNGIFDNMDNHRMQQESLDVYLYDSYPNFAYGTPSDGSDLRDRKWSRNLTEVRSICPHFGIMEQQSGANGWIGSRSAPSPKPGQLTLWALQSIAHGADYVSFFRWRTCAFSTEMYWQGILPWSNRDNRVLSEVRSLHERLQRLQPLAGARFVPAFGVLRDYDNRWDAKADAAHGELEDISSQGIFQASQLLHAPMDYIYLRPDSQLPELEKVPVLLDPHPYIVTKERAALLRAYVEDGGCLVLGCRTGMKDIDGKCPMHLLPGLLRDLAGVDVFDYTQVGTLEGPVPVEWGSERLMAASFNDLLEPLEGTRVLARYASGHYEGVPALTERRVGKGRVLYFGAAFTREAACALLRYTGVAEAFRNILRPDPDCELVVREDASGKRYYVLLNYTDRLQKAEAVSALENIETGEPAQGFFALQPYEVRVLG